MIKKSETLEIKTGCGNMYLTISEDKDKEIFELFGYSGKNGSCSAAVMDALTRIISFAVNEGVDPLDIVHSIGNIKCHKSDISTNSCMESIAIGIANYIENKEGIVDTNGIDIELYEDNKEEDKMDKCGNCGSNSLMMTEGCMTCKMCGWSACSV